MTTAIPATPWAFGGRARFHPRPLFRRTTAIAGLTAADSWAYGYDGFDRLKQATNLGNAALSESFNYTPNG